MAWAGLGISIGGLAPARALAAGTADTEIIARGLLSLALARSRAAIRAGAAA